MVETNHHEDHLAGLDAAELFRRGTEALNAKNYAEASRFLQAALESERSPDHLSQYALALARHTGEIRTGIALCHEAVKAEPKNPEHFLRLGTIYLIGGKRREAVRAFHLGLRMGRHPGIKKSLQALGYRSKPMLPFLSRTHPLNKFLGKIRMSLAKKR